MKLSYTFDDLVQAIEAAGVRRGDLVHLHSALFPLGMMEGVEPAEIPRRVYEAFRQVIGSEGTLSVPTAFEDYARFGTPYDCRRSPVDRSQGALGQYVTDLPQSFRTYCPMCAIAAVGPLAEEIAHSRTASAFGTDSGWEKLYVHDAKFCFLGVPPNLAFNYVYFIQFRHGVPHFYNKLYATPIFDDGRPVPLPVTSFVRYLDKDYRISESAVEFERHLDEQGLIARNPVGRGWLYSIESARRVFDEGERKLKENLYYFLKWPPNFVPGRIPTDGNTGPLVTDAVKYKNAAGRP